MVSGGADHLVGLWDAREGAMVNRGIGHSSTVFGVAPALNGRSVASVDGAGEIKIWDVREMRHPVYENQYVAGLNACAFDASGSYVFVACDDGKAQVFILDEARSSWTISTFDKECESIAVTNDGEMVVCSSADGNVAVCTSQ
jgi:WD40 repeat protein